MASGISQGDAAAVEAAKAEAFEARCNAVKIEKSQMNSIIMNYLVTEGYAKAAADFAREANLSPSMEIAHIEERKKIKRAIYSGRILEAIENINELNPTILESNPALHFALLRLQLVELIKAQATGDQDIQPAINFATEYLAPRAPTNPQWKDALEKTMALLIFDHDKLVPELQAIMDPQLRVDVAREVNEAILRSTGEASRSQLIEMLKIRVYAENEARQTGKDLPAKLDIGLDTITSEASQAVTSGHDNNGSTVNDNDQMVE